MVQQSMDRLENRYDTRVDAVDARFDQVDARFDQVEQELSTVKENTQRILVVLDGVAQAVETVTLEGAARNIQLNRHQKQLGELATHTGHTFKD